ncbi:hypothetical protein [uncultured Paludibaculum sp.]|uniref:hypothetical protein n=1 Tax=uncultured Paludibaculum sp. TaxID=1765020 RepID=UPI002AAC13BB|nr:hypothetical protein [uncultured Paludibaculum sp.]
MATSLQLNMSDDTPSRQNQIVAVRIELPTQDFHVKNSPSPERAEHFTYEYVLNDLLSQT